MTEENIGTRPPSPLHDIEPIELSSGQLIRSSEDLARFVELPALPACKDLYDKNIRTTSSSANKKDEDGAYIVVDLTSLSEENKAIATEIGEIIPTDSTVAGGQPVPAEVKLYVPFDANDSPETMSQKLLKLVESFKKQRLLWAPIYTLGEIKRAHGYADDEEVDPEDFSGEGYYFDQKTGLFHLSEELFQKSLEYSEDASAA